MTLKTLEVGKTYAHSKSGIKNGWKITHQWSDDLFEGMHVDTWNAGTPVMFNKFGKPIGARGKTSYNPDDWHLIIPKEYEYILLCSDNTISKQWHPLVRGMVVTPELIYVVREKKANKTCKLMNHREMKDFLMENLK